MVPELFLNARGESMTRSGFEYILRKHTRTAAKCCPSLVLKRVSPHVLRHTCALTVLQATKDIRKVALWLGHVNMQTTEMYIRADPSVNLEALESIVAPKLRSGRFKATDEMMLAEMGRDMLEAYGYEVTIRNSSLEALETFQNQPTHFDLVVTDQTMQGMTGAELSVRLLEIRPDIPIIMCSGYSSVISEEKAMSMGIKKFALKPLTKKDLARLARMVLDQSFE